jgi:hypothetical protein
MIILTENNFKKIDKIPRETEPDLVPDVVFYPLVFNSSAIKKINDIINLVQFNKNGKAWFTDDPSWQYHKDLPPFPFSALIDKVREDIHKLTGKGFNSCLITRIKDENTWKQNDTSWLGYDFVVPSIFIGSSVNIEFENKDSNNHSLNVKSGSLLIQRESVLENWNVNLIPDNTGITYIITFFHFYPSEKITKKYNNSLIKKISLPYDISRIYLSSKYRMAFARKIKTGLSPIHSIKEGYQCFMKNGINTLKKYINLGKLIGTGDWGNVYSACLPIDRTCKRKFAIKMARITDEEFKDPYSETGSAWYEIWMLKDILKPMVAENMCPNLPVFIDTFLCDKCDFIFRKGDVQHPCVITVMELASSDMRDYLRFKTHSDEEIYSALFQIMAGLHAIQMGGQILNNDIKSKNILVYDVKPGGFWHYRLRTTDFYVPNFGKMFVLNDFGVSTLYNPNFQLYPNKNRSTFNLGSRFAINIDGIFSPIKASTEYYKETMRKTKPIDWIDSINNDVYKKSNGATYKLDRKTGQVIDSHAMLTPIQKSYLFRNGVSTNPKIWSFYERPDIIPPFEFYNDVQDALRTFTGGKRATQSGNHTSFPTISNIVKKSIEPYLGVKENASKRVFSVHAYHVLAGEFLLKFFTETYSYQKRPKGIKISFYNMNKCLSK